jgi:hypothetical protein
LDPNHKEYASVAAGMDIGSRITSANEIEAKSKKFCVFLRTSFGAFAAEIALAVAQIFPSPEHRKSIRACP